MNTAISTAVLPSAKAILASSTEVAAAGQAETRRFFLSNAVGSEGAAVNALASARALDEIVLYTWETEPQKRPSSH